jgi:carbon-monoxide dehydrogenase medium subunit
MYPPSFAYFAPHSLNEALDLLEKHGEEAKVLAGGHSLIPALKFRLADPASLIDLGRIPDLRGIHIDGQNLAIGALTTHTEVASSEHVKRHFPGLADAASVIGDLQVRNRGTIGGSIAHADPAADLPVMLTSLNASFTLVSASAERSIKAENFFVDFFTTMLEPDEILREISIPLPEPRTGTAYVKLPHPASGYVVVSAAAALCVDSSGICQSARVVLGGMGGVPHRAAATERALQSQRLSEAVIAAAAARAADGTSPHPDSYADEDYKRHMATVYAQRAIAAAAARC